MKTETEGLNLLLYLQTYAIEQINDILILLYTNFYFRYIIYVKNEISLNALLQALSIFVVTC